MIKIIIYLTLILLSLNVNAVDEKPIIFKSPVSIEDDSLLDIKDIKGFRSYCGIKPNDYLDDIVYTGNVSSNMNIIINNLKIGINYCVLNTFDTEDRESKYSDPFTVTVILVTYPKHPTNFMRKLI